MNSFNLDTKRARTKQDLLQIALEVKQHYIVDGHAKFPGTWVYELDSVIKKIRGSRGNVISQSPALQSFRTDLREVIHTLSTRN